jgi:phytoene synthase
MHKDLYLDDIFKKGSKTYYNSTFFFDEQTRKDVTILYSFVRVIDDYIDDIPQDVGSFFDMREKYQLAHKSGVSKNYILHMFVDLMRRKNIDPDWVDAFFDSMEMDISKKEYRTISETEQYMYGSAEVVGLMMAQILDLPKKSFDYACDLGKAMQYINFIRDIGDDLVRGRIYFPQNEMKLFGLNSLDPGEAQKKNFDGFIQKQVKRYFSWQESAEKGYAYIPKKYLIPIKTAADMYKWTAHRILKNPSVVYEQQVKPSWIRIYGAGIKNLATRP